MMSKLNEVKVICADGAYDLYTSLLRAWHVSDVVNINSQARAINGGLRAPSIQEDVIAQVFEGTPHAYLTIIKSLEHLDELLGLPHESQGKVVALVADYASELSRANQKILQVGGHPVMISELERTPHNSYEPENNILLRAILEASK